MYAALKDQLTDDLAQIRADGLFKAEVIIRTPQAAEIGVGDASVLNLCANNYLGLADHPAMVAASQQALDRWGFGMASVRFICGTQEIHKELEARLSAFLQTEDTILYGSCFDANGGLFETLLGPEDAVISDALNHASIIAGTLGKALGGASGGYTSGRREIVELLRQRSRPYLFSNTLAPPIAATSLKVLDMLGQS